MAADLEGEKTLECVAGRTHRQHFSSPILTVPLHPLLSPVPHVSSLSRVHLSFTEQRWGRREQSWEISVLSEIADAFDGSFFSFLVETIRTK